ncbi:MAG: hypothetical protein QNJ97_18310 [Myxococcota bacterium]|nr:hypothetical protein [Myxococcota bacterium]
MNKRKVPGLVGFIAMACALLACSKPTKVEIIPSKVVLDGAGTSKKLEVKVYDQDGAVMKEGIDVVWFSDDTSIIKLTHDGEVTSVASGEATVEVEIVGAGLKAEVPIRVKIPASINVSHERLRLWTGQIKENVWAEVHSEKGAFIEGYLPEWVSEDETIVGVEQIKDPKRRQSWVKLTGLKSGTTHIAALFEGIAKRIRVAVYDEDEEVAMDGTRIPKEEKEAAEKKKEEEKKKKKKKRKK